MGIMILFLTLLLSLMAHAEPQDSLEMAAELRGRYGGSRYSGGIRFGGYRGSYIRYTRYGYYGYYRGGTVFVGGGGGAFVGVFFFIFCVIACVILCVVCKALG